MPGGGPPQQPPADPPDDPIKPGLDAHLLDLLDAAATAAPDSRSDVLSAVGMDRVLFAGLGGSAATSAAPSEAGGRTGAGRQTPSLVSAPPSLAGDPSNESAQGDPLAHSSMAAPWPGALDGPGAATADPPLRRDPQHLEAILGTFPQ